jgi:hypothetical protein
MGTKTYAGGNTQRPIDQYLVNDCSVEDAITATAGGTKAAARALTAAVNRISVCATAADSVLLPLADAGARVVIANDGAASAQVFGAGTDTINAVATATGVAQAAGTKALYACVKAAPAGNWIRVLSA